MAKLQAKYLYIEERKEWMGVVAFIGDDNTTEVLTVGCEHTEAEIKAWCDAAIRNRPWVEGNPPAPDMYERNKTLQ